MQRDRVVAVEGEAPASSRLAIGARDRGDDLFGSDSAQVPSLDASHDRVEPRPRRGGGEAAASALSRLSLASDCGHQRFGHLGRGLEALDANGHHIEVARSTDLTARGGQRRDRHPSRFADAVEKKPGNGARLFQRFADLMDPLWRLFAGAGKLRRRGADRSNKSGAAMLRPSVITHLSGFLRLDQFGALAQREFLHLAG
jgi:hypothetical protein